MGKITKQSEFSRVKANEAKMGAYYTDPEHCRFIGRFFEFPQDEVCCLEPSIGDGKAVIAVTGKDKEEKSNIKIFGVEINENTYMDVSRNKNIHNCIWADFLNDVIISHGSFSFLFMNPPYGTQGDGERYELAFLKKVEPYLMKGAAAAVVVPFHVAIQKKFVITWCGMFHTRHVYRFHEIEYEKYHQVVLIGTKKQKAERNLSEEEHLQGVMQVEENISKLPKDYSGERIPVPKSSESGIGEFMSRIFHAQEAANFVKSSSLQILAHEKIRIGEYVIDNLGRPPILPSEGQMYLLAVSGAGQGLVGNEKDGDLHLQRGVSKIVTRSGYVQDENGKMKEEIISFPQISFNLVESDGRIRTLQ